MNRNRILKITTLTLALTNLIGLTPIKANAEWKVSGSDWYYTDSTGNVVTGWQQIDGNWYYMWSDGTMAKNTWIENGDKWYYLGGSGAMVYNRIVDNYAIGSGGYWVATSRGAFEDLDIERIHKDWRTEIGQPQRYIDISNMYSHTNLVFKKWSDFLNKWIDELSLRTFANYIMTDAIYIDEAKNMCVGKIFNNKYIITDIKFFSEKFTAQDCTNNWEKHKDSDYKIEVIEKLIEDSSIYEYKSNSPYVYDRYELWNNTGRKGIVAEAMRVVIEFDEV